MVTINTTEDLLKLLDENEDFLKAVRQRILTEELLALPARFDAFDKGNLSFRLDMLAFQKDIFTLHEETCAFQREMRVFANTMERFIETASADIRNMRQYRDRVGSLWGWDDRLEMSMARKVYYRLSEDLGVRSLDVVSAYRFGSLNPHYEATKPFYKRVEDAGDAGIISEAEERNVHRLDLVARTRRRGSKATIWLVVQAASVIKHDDITKARDGARVLAKVFGEETIPAVYGFEIDGANKELADENNVRIELVNRDSL